MVSRFDEYPQQIVIDAFGKRTGFFMNPDCTIHQNLGNFIKQNEDKFFVLVRSSQFGFLKTNDLRAVAIVRHPLTAYEGFGDRHSEFVPTGIPSEEGVRWFANFWNKSVDDFMASDSVILRYEFLKKGLTEEVDSSVFKGWRPSLRTPSLGKHLKKLMLELVGDRYFKIYADWIL